MKSPTNDTLFCEEQASRSNRLFRVSHVFAEPTTRDALLPLHALFSSIEQVCAGTRDEGVAHSRLAWWQEELAGRGIEASAHPIMKEWVRTGADKRIPDALVHRLVQAARSRLDGTAPRDSGELRSLCLDAGSPLIEMELALCGCDPEIPGLEQLGIRAGLAQLIRESAGGNGQGSWWWLPLKLLARHGVSRANLEASTPDAATTALFAELLDRESWDLQRPIVSAPDISIENQRVRHLFVLDALYAGRYRKWRASGPAKLREGLMTSGPGDVFTAWRAARAFSRQR